MRFWEIQPAQRRAAVSSILSVLYAFECTVEDPRRATASPEMVEVTSQH